MATARPGPGQQSAEGGSTTSTPKLAEAGFDDLLLEVLTRVHGVLDEKARWELLLDAVVTIGAEPSLDVLLTHIVKIAGRLARAQYVALGVIAEGPARTLRTFVHHGMTPEQVVEIGDLPTGHGLLGLIIDQPEPLRLHDIAAHPSSYGFPEHHPPMSSFLGVPVRIRDRIFGNLYLTEKEDGGDFTEEDERIVVALAAAAGVAVENARLHEEAGRRERWLSATAEITGLLARSTTGQDALQTVADRAREVAGADMSWVVAGPKDEQLSVQVVSGAAVDMDELAELSLERSLAREVVRSRVPISVEEMASDPRARSLSGVNGWPELGPVIVVPLGNESGIEGVLALGWTPAHASSFSTVDPNLPASFAEQAALALQVSRAREDQQRLALLEDRDRIARDLHDLVIQRLFAVGLGLQSAGRVSDNPEITERMETAVDDLDSTIRDIRRTIFALGALDEAADIQAEVTRMIQRSAATLKFRPSLTFEGPVRTLINASAAPDVLAVLGEALSNAARHANASKVEVVLSATDEIALEVTDNGVGIDEDAVESGLSNMRLRAERRGGQCLIESPRAGGTRIRWSIPLDQPDVR